MSPLRRLTRFELACAKDAFIAIFPGDQGIATMDIDGYVKDTLARIPLEPVIGVRLAIWIVALAPIFVLRRLVTLHGLAPSDRELVLVALATSRFYAVRQLLLALKAVAALLYAGDPTVRARLLGPSEPLLTPSRIVRKAPRSLRPSAPAPETPNEKQKPHAAVA